MKKKLYYGDETITVETENLPDGFKVGQSLPCQCFTFPNCGTGQKVVIQGVDAKGQLWASVTLDDNRAYPYRQS